MIPLSDFQEVKEKIEEAKKRNKDLITDIYALVNDLRIKYKDYGLNLSKILRVHEDLNLISGKFWFEHEDLYFGKFNFEKFLIGRYEIKVFNEHNENKEIIKNSELREIYKFLNLEIPFLEKKIQEAIDLKYQELNQKLESLK